VNHGDMGNGFVRRKQRFEQGGIRRFVLGRPQDRMSDLRVLSI